MRALCFLVPLGLSVACKSDPKPDPPKTTEAPLASASASAAPVASGPTAASSSNVTRLAAKTEAEEQIGYAIGTSGDRIAVSAFKRKGPGETNPGSVFVFKKAGAACLELPHLRAGAAALIWLYPAGALRRFK